MLRFRVLGSGSEGNASLVEAGGARVLLDAGLSPRQLVERLQSAGVDPASLDGVLVSHEHGDHARGAAAFSRKWGVPLFATLGTFGAAGFDPATLPELQAIEPGETRTIRQMSVRAVGVPHDAAQPVAFVIRAGEVSLGHATDLGHLSRAFVLAFSGCDAVLVESNYDPSMLRDGPYPWSLKERILGPFGHLSNGDVARLLEKGLADGCQRVVLAHLSRKNNHPELAQFAAQEALSRGGRNAVQLTLAGVHGTDWITVRKPRPPSGQPGPPGHQMRLF